MAGFVAVVFITTSLPERGGKPLPMKFQVDGVRTLAIGYFQEEHAELPKVQSWLARIDQLSRGLWKFNRTGDEGSGQDLSRALHVKGRIRSDQMFMDLAIEVPEISQRMIDDPEGVKNAVTILF